MTNEYGCKVCRVLDERGIESYDDRLVEQWKGDGQARKGYRQLARWLNVTLLRREMDKAGLSTLGAEAESKYERLVAEDSNATELENLLLRDGIDVEDLKKDFVSYGVVRTHITDCLGEEYEKPEPDEWEEEAIRIATEHAHSRIEEAVGSLQSKDRLTAETDTEVSVTVELECTECQSRVPLQQAIRRGYLCWCAEEDGATD